MLGRRGRGYGLVWGMTHSVLPDGFEVEILSSLGAADTPSLALVAPSPIATGSTSCGSEGVGRIRCPASSVGVAGSVGGIGRGFQFGDAVIFYRLILCIGNIRDGL